MNELIVGRIYKHFKGNYYEVLNIAKDCESLKEVVVYRDVKDLNKIWVRDKENFLSEVDHNKYPFVKEKYRFEFIYCK